MKSILRFGSLAAVVVALSLSVGAAVSSAHTVSRTVQFETDPGNGHCLRKSISLRESTSNPVQMFGYQMLLKRDCVTPIVLNDFAGSPTNNNWARLKLFIYTYNGPYFGYSICRNVDRNYSTITANVSNQFSNYSKGPCGAGYYAAALCTVSIQELTVTNPYPGYTGGVTTGRCDQPANTWVWTNDWHYFA